MRCYAPVLVSMDAGVMNDKARDEWEQAEARRQEERRLDREADDLRRAAPVAGREETGGGGEG